MTCPECHGVITGDIGHHVSCSHTTDDGSEAYAKAWLASRPEGVSAALEKYPPSHLYRMKSTGQKVFLTRYNENKDGSVTTCSVGVTKKFNPETFLEREVFGVELSDLEDLGEVE
jgi:hypothetical protein